MSIFTEIIKKKILINREKKVTEKEKEVHLGALPKAHILNYSSVPLLTETDL